MQSEVREDENAVKPEKQTETVSNDLLDFSPPAMSALSSLLGSRLVLAEQVNAPPVSHKEDVEGSLQAESQPPLTESQSKPIAVHEALASTPCTPEATLSSFPPNGYHQEPRRKHPQSTNKRSYEEDNDEEEVLEYIFPSPPKDSSTPISLTEIQIDDRGKVFITEISKFEQVG